MWTPKSLDDEKREKQLDAEKKTRRQRGPVSHFYTPWKRQKTFGFLTFSGGIEMWHWTKMG